MASASGEGQPSSMAASRAKQLAGFFSRSLADFSSSGAAFRVLCTVPQSSSSGSDPQPSPPSQPVPRLTILDSSFNPPTVAHLDMVLSSLASSPPPGRVLLLLSVQNADKAPQPAPFEQRLCMMEALAREVVRRAQQQQEKQEKQGSVTVDVGVTTRPYFHDKARAVAEGAFYGEPAPAATFLAGFDTLVRVLDPKYYGGEEGMAGALGPFFGASGLRVTMRPGGGWGGVGEQEAYLDGLRGSGVRAGWAGRIELVPGFDDGVGVSSSQVRDVVSRGDTRDLDSLVVEDVAQYIISEQLYRKD